MQERMRCGAMGRKSSMAGTYGYSPCGWTVHWTCSFHLCDQHRTQPLFSCSCSQTSQVGVVHSSAHSGSLLKIRMLWAFFSIPNETMKVIISLLFKMILNLYLIARSTWRVSHGCFFGGFFVLQKSFSIAPLLQYFPEGSALESQLWQGSHSL